MITEDYVSFEIAKLLKEKGFDEMCQKVYMHNGQLLWAQIFMEGESFVDNKCIGAVADYNDWITYTQGEYAYLCPTLQMAQKWFREEKHLAINPSTFYRKLEGHELHNWDVILSTLTLTLGSYIAATLLRLFQLTPTKRPLKRL